MEALDPKILGPEASARNVTVIYGLVQQWTSPPPGVAEQEGISYTFIDASMILSIRHLAAALLQTICSPRFGKTPGSLLLKTKMANPGEGDVDAVFGPKRGKPCLVIVWGIVEPSAVLAAAETFAKEQPVGLANFGEFANCERIQCYYGIPAVELTIGGLEKSVIMRVAAREV